MCITSVLSSTSNTVVASSSLHFNPNKNNNPQSNEIDFEIPYQNAENSVSALLDFNIFWGTCPKIPLVARLRVIADIASAMPDVSLQPSSNNSLLCAIFCLMQTYLTGNTLL